MGASGPFMTQLPVPGIEAEGKPFSAAGPGGFVFIRPEDCSSPGGNDGRLVFPAENFILPRILCIILSLLVHLALMAMPGPPPVARLQVAMEFSLVAGPAGPKPARQTPEQGGIGGSAPAPEIGRKAPAQPAAVKQAAGKPAPQRSQAVAPGRETNRDRQRSEPLTPAPGTRPVRPVPSEEARPARLMEPSIAESPAPADAGFAESLTSSADDSGNAPVAAMNAPGVRSPGSGASGSGLSRSGGSGGGPAYVFGEAGAPAFLRRVAPKYPRSSLARREQGVVMLLLSLDRHGALLDVSVTQSAGPRLDEAAVQAARASTYLPATRNGEPHACTATLPIRFTLRQ